MHTKSQSIILVTGGTGFLGSHVVEQALEAGYTVRATVRPGKVSKFKATYPSAGDQLQIYEVGDLAEGEFPEVFEGVTAVVHVAAPNFTEAKPNAEMLKGTVDGALNVVNQAVKAKVPKIIATSSVITLFDPDFKRAMTNEPLNADSWNSVTLDSVKNLDELSGVFVYNVGKAVAERKLWEIAEQHPEIDFTTLVPPALYGPFVPNWPRPATREGLITNIYIYQLITSGHSWPTVPISSAINVKDIAKAHILAISAPAREDGKRKRLLVSLGQFTWDQAVELVKKERSELAHRLPDGSIPLPQVTKAPLDTSFTAEVLGLKEYIPWQTTVLQALDAVVEWEKGEGTTA